MKAYKSFGNSFNINYLLIIMIQLRFPETQELSLCHFILKEKVLLIFLYFSIPLAAHFGAQAYSPHIQIFFWFVSEYFFNEILQIGGRQLVVHSVVTFQTNQPTTDLISQTSLAG